MFEVNYKFGVKKDIGFEELEFSYYLNYDGFIDIFHA